MRSGKFITFEGGDCAGKSTQVKLLAEKLRDRGRTVVTTREPGGSPDAERIRRLILDASADWDAPTETLLHFAARADHYTTLIAPALRSGAWVLCDRFSDSTRAYQGKARGLDRTIIDTLERLILGEVQPDLTLIFDLPPETALSRLGTRAAEANRYDRMDVSFHRKLREGFLEIAASEPDRCVVIDADAEIDTVLARVERAIATRLCAQEHP